MPPIILTFSDWYLPGSKGGGAVTALVNLIELLGDDYDFRVVTRNRDLGDACPYQDLPAGQWTCTGKARVLYTGRITPWGLLRRVREVGPAVIYLNSFFSRFTIQTLLLRRLRLLPRASVILAPRGELFPAALAIKARRKRMYRRIVSMLRLWRDVIWQASSALEREHIASVLRCHGGEDQATVVLSTDVPDSGLAHVPPGGHRPEKRPGRLSLLFLSRIGPQKNLLFLLELLNSLEGEIKLDLYGPVDDAAFWDKCQQRIRELPLNIRVAYRGPVASDRVMQVFGAHHFQILPTLGENFGYAILEALASGCPVMTSDRTPWRDLERLGAGWDLPLEARDRWIAALKSCVEMGQGAYQQMSRRARAFFEEWTSTAPFRAEAINLFQFALAWGLRSEEQTYRDSLKQV
jgi:glycosyltransferase involved in cell wall biosynthesis